MMCLENADMLMCLYVAHVIINFVFLLIADTDSVLHCIDGSVIALLCLLMRERESLEMCSLIMHAIFQQLAISQRFIWVGYL